MEVFMKQHLSYILAVILVLSCFVFPSYAEESSLNTSTDNESSDITVSTDTPDSTDIPSSSEPVSSDDPISSEEPSTEDPVSSVAPESFNITFNVNDIKDGTPVIGMMFTINNGDICKSGETVAVDSSFGEISFNTTPIAGKEIVNVTLTNGTLLTPDEDGAYSLGILDENMVVTVLVRDASISDIKVNISSKNDFSVVGTATYDDSKEYHDGDTLNLIITPVIVHSFDDQGNDIGIALLSSCGILSVTVNGVAREDINVFGMDIQIPVEGEMTIDIVFARFYAVGTFSDTLDEDGESSNETGGQLLATKLHESQQVGSIIYPLDGTDLTIRIKRNDGYRLKELRLNSKNGKDITKDVNGGYYTFTNIGNNYTLHAVFEPSNEVSYPITARVDGEGGTVTPFGTTHVDEGESITIEITPYEGFVVDTVKLDGIEKNLFGTNKITIIADSQHELVVTFKPINGTVPDSSDDTSDTTITPPVVDDPTFITENDVSSAATGAEVRIDISKKSLFSAEAIIRVNALLAAGKDVYIGEFDSYMWKIPAGSSLPVPQDISGGLVGFDFKVYINTGSKSDEIRDAINVAIDYKNYKNAENITIQREGNFVLPDGARLLVNVESYFENGWFLDWLEYNELSDGSKFEPFYTDLGGYLISVNNNWVELYMPQNSRYGLLVVRIEKFSKVTVEWTGNHCSPSVPCGYTEVDGVRTGTFACKSGENLIINIIVRDGFVIDSITSSRFDSQITVSSGGVLLENGGKGGTGIVSINIEGVSADGTVTVKTVAVETDDGEEPKNGIDWTMIILIVVIVIAMVGGGVIFVIKWRQSDDDDDDDDEEYYDDDDDDDAIDTESDDNY